MYYHLSIKSSIICGIYSIVLSYLLLLTGCSSVPQDGPPDYDVDVSHIPDATPRDLPKSRYGNPRSYTVLGKRYYVLKSAAGYKQRGIASWYGTKFQGQITSTREPYNMLAMTAASPTLPLPTFVRVTNLENNRSVIVKVNDRGPFVKGRILDLSYAAAKKLGYAKKGFAYVEVSAINPRQTSLAVTHHSPFSPKQHTGVALASRDNHTPDNEQLPAFYIQVGAFHDPQHAQTLKKHLESLLNTPVIIAKEFQNLLPIYRVRVGPIFNQNTLQQLKTKLQG